MAASWKLLKGARVMLGITQRELAEALNVGRASIDRLDRGLGGPSVREAAQKFLEAQGVRFIEASKDSAGGVFLPPDPEKAPRLRRQGSSGKTPAKHGAGS
jgi:transcriptional regulator with XRE-family HTH domain